MTAYKSFLVLALSLLPYTAQGLPQTTLTLAVSANPSAFGAPLTLTATTSNSASTGKVTFFDGVSIIGIKPVSSGVATLSTVLLSAGTHVLTVYYRDDSTVLGGSNTIIQTIKAVPGGAFVSLNPLRVGAMPNVGDRPNIVVGDFNGDGKVDLAVAGQSGNPEELRTSVSVMLGNGDGTFQTPVSYMVYGTQVTSLAVGDFDGDGNSDLAAVAFDSPISQLIGHVSVSILLGNGDGTFRTGVFKTNIDTYSFNAIVVGDFNSDGKADILVGDSAPVFNGFDGRLVLLPGNGDGTFGLSVYSASVVSPLGIADFNGDSRPDLATGNFAGFNPFILLGNGSGTAPSAANVILNGRATAFVSGDFNGDGKVDLAVGGLDPGGVRTTWVLLGNGDGTFQAAVSYAAGSAVSTGDFNGDGILDLLVSNSTGTAILQGNGDGAFTQKPASNITASTPVLVADFNGDGKADVLTLGTVLLGAPSVGVSLTAMGGAMQSVPAAAPFGVPLEVTALNNGIPLPGVTINFSAPSSGATATLSSQTAVTNATGVASITATAGFTAGSYVVTASYQGATATFALMNTAAASITATGGTPQTATTGTAFAQPLQVTVKDALGNPAAGVTVIFGGPLSGPGALVSSPMVVTNAQGIARVTATANNIAGSYVVTASAGGSLSTTFSLTNLIAVQSFNLARGKIATQSSTLAGYSIGAASAAIDGGFDGNFFDGSVTHTNADPNAWWQVDLGGSATVNSILILNRTDCCSDRLSDYWVFVSDTPFLATDTPTTLQARAGTFSSHQTVMPNPSATIPVGAQGRYVRVQLSGTNNLSLAEVEVIGTPPVPTNLARGRTATQSSTLPGYSTDAASAAVDGNFDGNFFNGSVTHTNADLNAWWQVDLGASAAVSSVMIFNRTDCCADRLSDYWVFVSDTPFDPADTPATLATRVAPTFYNHQTSAPNPSSFIPLVGRGRYVRVQLSGTNNLSLAEVQVFGTGGAAPTNIAVGKPATQSSTLSGYPTDAANAAVDGNPDGDFFHGSVTHTNADSNAWWQVDLGASAAVSSIVVWNRTDCCADRLSDCWVFVSDTPFLSTDTPATLQARTATFASHQMAAPAPATTIPAAAQGRYVRIQLSGTNNLSLAEVQVFGQ